MKRGGKVLLSDKIADHIQLRGPLTTPRLAALLGGSEKTIAIAIGKAKGRFLMNEDEAWVLNDSRR